MTAESATQKGVLERGKTDWLAVEKQYRAGVLSIREIAKQHGVTDTGIRKKAKVLGWTRDLKEQVMARAAEVLSSQDSSQAPVCEPDPVRAAIEEGAATVAQAQREQEAKAAQAAARSEQARKEGLEDAVRNVVDLVRTHRMDIARGRELTSLLTAQLTSVARSRDHFEQLVEEETAEDKGRKRYNFLMDAVALPKHAATIRDLSAAMKNLVYLERQAFGLSDQPPEDKPPEGEAEATVTPGFPELAGKWEKVVAGAARVTH